MHKMTRLSLDQKFHNQKDQILKNKRKQSSVKDVRTSREATAMVVLQPYRKHSHNWEETVIKKLELKLEVSAKNIGGNFLGVTIYRSWDKKIVKNERMAVKNTALWAKKNLLKTNHQSNFTKLEIYIKQSLDQCCYMQLKHQTWQKSMRKSKNNEKKGSTHNTWTI